MRMLKHKPLDVRQSVNSIWRQLMDAVFCFLSFIFDVAVFSWIVGGCVLTLKEKISKEK